MTLVRFHTHQVLQTLAEIVRKRIGAPDELGCMLFPSETIAGRFSSTLIAKGEGLRVDTVRFLLPSVVGPQVAHWTSFFVVFYHQDLHPETCTFWTIVGDGMSSHHVEFCMDWIEFMDSKSANPSFWTSAPCLDLNRRPRPYRGQIRLFVTSSK